MKKEKPKISFGAIITEAGSSTKNKTGSWRILKPIIDMKKCVGCGICEKFCPDCCIKIINKKSIINYDYCKGCGICAAECPFKAIIMEKEKK